MSNACISRFNNLNIAVVKPFPGRRKYRVIQLRSFFTLASPCGTSIPVIQKPSPFVVSSCLRSLDAPQRSEEWFALRKDKLTTSTFSTALGFWKGNRRFELWNEKVYSPDEIIEASRRFAMDWGVLKEPEAIERYKSITGRDVGSLGFAMHADERLRWIGASPDGVLDGYPEGGILEVKCPYNKGKPEKALPWSKMPFYYMPQVQGQMEVMDRDWVDLYCWTPNGSTVFRVCRDREYWTLIHNILREFWWENVIPAREARVLGKEEEAESYKPTPTHKQTGLAISRSLKLAAEVKLTCREIAGPFGGKENCAGWIIDHKKGYRNLNKLQAHFSQMQEVWPDADVEAHFIHSQFLQAHEEQLIDLRANHLRVSNRCFVYTITY